MNGINNVIQNIDALIFGTDLTSIVGLTGIDLYPSENHDLGAEKTKLAIESGANITDHAAILDAKITLTGIISNISNIFSGVPLVIGAIGVKSTVKTRDGWEKLVTLRDARQPLTVVTSLKVYENMLITDLSALVDKTTGPNLFFTLQLEEMRTVGSQIVQLPPSKVSGPATNKTSKINGGERQSSQVPESVAAKGLDYLKGVL